MGIKSYFTEHPESAGESYGEHFMVAMCMSRQLFGAAIAATVHAVLPNFHKTTASERVHSLAHCLETGNRAAITPLKAVPCRDTLRQTSLNPGAIQPRHSAGENHHLHSAPTESR